MTFDRTRLFLGVGFLMLLTTISGGAQEKTATFAERAREQAAGYQCTMGTTNRKLTLVPNSALRWSNPISGREAQGEVFLWTERGRPVLVCSMYEMPGPDNTIREHHEFSSLTDEKLNVNGAATWSSDVSGIAFQILSDASPPATEAQQRLLQMREIVSKIQTSKMTRDAEPQSQPLRLLRQPVHRYQSPDQGIIDGALFAFVEATDPDVLLMLEARESKTGPTWHLAFARMNSGSIEGTLDGKPIWQAPVLPWKDVINRQDKPYAAFRVR